MSALLNYINLCYAETNMQRLEELAKIITDSSDFILWPSLGDPNRKRSFNFDYNYPLILAKTENEIIDICQKIININSTEFAWSPWFDRTFIVRDTS